MSALGGEVGRRQGRGAGRWPPEPAAKAGLAGGDGAVIGASAFPVETTRGGAVPATHARCRRAEGHDMVRCDGEDRGAGRAVFQNIFEMVLPSSSLGPRTRGLVSPSCCESRRLCLWNLDTALLRSQLPGDAQGRRPSPHRHQQQQRPHPLAPCHSICAAIPRHPGAPGAGPSVGWPPPPPFFLSSSFSLSLPECLLSHCLRDSEHPRLRPPSPLRLFCTKSSALVWSRRRP